MGSIFALVGITIGFALCRDVPGDLALALAPTNTTGVVTSVSTVSIVKVNRVHPVAFNFTYQVDGQSHDAVSSTLSPPATWRPGAAVPVEYFAARPDVARITGTTRTGGGWPTAIIPTVFSVLGITLLFVPLRGYARRRAAFVHGVPALGVVRSFGLDRTVRINGRNPTKLAWTFADPRGRSFQGAISALEPGVLGERSVGDAIVVLYDPKNPKVNTLWVA